MTNTQLANSLSIAFCAAFIGFAISIPGCKEEQAAATPVSVATPDNQQTTATEDAAPDSAAPQHAADQDAADQDAADQDGDSTPEIAATPMMRRPPPEEQIGAPEPKSRQRSTLRRGGVRDIIFDDLEFGIEPGEDYEPEMLTDKIRELDGKKVILRGFMDGSALFQTKGITQFVLIRDNSICCFGPGAKIYHNVQIDMDEGESIDFPRIRPLQVEGVFSIRPWTNPGDGKVYSVFHIQASKAKK